MPEPAAAKVAVDALPTSPNAALTTYLASLEDVTSEEWEAAGRAYRRKALSSKEWDEVRRGVRDRPPFDPDRAARTQARKEAWARAFAVGCQRNHHAAITAAERLTRTLPQILTLRAATTGAAKSAAFAIAVADLIDEEDFDILVAAMDETSAALPSFDEAAEAAASTSPARRSHT